MLKISESLFLFVIDYFRYTNLKNKIMSRRNKSRIAATYQRVNSRSSSLLRIICDEIYEAFFSPHQVTLSMHSLVYFYILFFTMLAVTGIAVFFAITTYQPHYYDKGCNCHCSDDCNFNFNENKCGSCSSEENDEHYSFNKKKDFLERCNGQTSNCRDNTNLICLDGICKCNQTNYWDGEQCVFKKSYRQRCYSDDECSLELMLHCDKRKNRCLCRHNR